MAKPMVARASDSYGKTHSMAKAMGVSMAKPMGPRASDSYGKTHSMAKVMGVSMAKPMGLNFQFLTMVAATMERDGISLIQNSEGSFAIFDGFIWTKMLTSKKGWLN